MTPDTACRRLQYMAAYLQSHRRTPEMDAIYARYCGEIIHTLRGMEDANSGIRRILHKGKVG